MFDRLKRLFRRAARQDVLGLGDFHRQQIGRLLEQLQPIGNEGASLDAVLAVANGRLSPQQLRQVQEAQSRHWQEAATPNVNWWSQVVDPTEPIWDQSDFWQPLGFPAQVPWTLNNTLRGEALPVYINEMGLKVIRDWSRKLLAFNEFALNASENRISYIVGKGFQYKVVARDDQRTATDDVDATEAPETNELCRKVQAVVDEFLDRERWGEREQECVKRCDRDGEALLRFFHVGEGKTAVRFVEPELLTDQSGVDNRQYGVITAEHDIEDVQAYSIVECPAHGWTPTDVPADEVVHIKLNTDHTAKRGLPTFFPVRKNLERADKLLRNMSILAQIRATFAVIRKHKQFSPSSVSAYQQAQADQTLTLPVTGRSLQLQQFVPGAVFDTSDKTEYDFPGSEVDASSFVAILQAELRAVAARLVMTEWMLTVDASNANFASSLVAEAPAVKNFERLQAFFARRFGDGQFGACRTAGALWRVIYNAVMYGRLPREALTDVEIQVEGPSLVVRDKVQETSRAKTLNEAGILSEDTWSKWEGLDRQQEQKKGAKPKQGAGAPPGGPPGAGGETPPPAPPGSAGGNGKGGGEGDPFDLFGEGQDFFSEARFLAEAGFTGKDRLGREWVNGRLVKKQQPAKAPQHAASEKAGKVKQVLQAIAKGAGAVKATAADVAAKVGLPVWDKLPAEAQRHLINTMTLAKAAEHKVMIGFHKGRQLAEQVARERGLPEQHVQRVGKVLATVDLVSAWTVNMPATLAATGSFTAAKVSSWVPVASLAYVAVSGARNPFALARAARKVLTGQTPQHAHEWMEAVDQDAVAKLLEAYDEHAGSDWFEALLYAGLDEHKGDIGKALEAAEQAMHEQPDGPDGLQEACVPNKDGKGHHDDKTGHPCSVGGQAPAGSEPGRRVKATLDPDLQPATRDVVLRLAASLKDTPGLSPEQRVGYFHTAQAVLKRMPAAAVERLSRHTRGARFFASTNAVRAGLMQLFSDSPGTVKALAQHAEVGGAFVARGDEQQGTLYLDGGMTQDFGPRDLKSQAGVYAHEMSHAIDGRDHEISGSPEWRAAFQAEVAGGRLSRYAAEKPSEGWAEFGRLLFSGEFSRARVKAAFPKCYAVWQARGLLEAIRLDEDGTVLLEDEEVRLPELFGKRLELPDGQHADVLLHPDQVGEDLKMVFGHWIDTNTHKRVEGPAGPSSQGGPAGGGKAPAETPRKALTKSMGRLGRVRDRARRRRVIHALRNEGELSAAIGGHNLPDSEPADVIHLEVQQPASKGGGWSRITDPETIRSHLRLREWSVREYQNKKTSPERRAQIEDWLGHYRLNFFEVKTLLVQAGEGQVKMSARAKARKERWQARYNAQWHMVVFDDRKGHKHSGHRLYYGQGVGSVRLGQLTPMKSFADVLTQLQG